MVQIIESSAHIIPILPNPSEEDLMRHIEICGRTSYKSEDKMTKSSHKEFCRKRLKERHDSIFSHARIVLRTNQLVFNELLQISIKGKNEMPFFLQLSEEGGRYLVSGTIRSFRGFCESFSEEINYSESIFDVLHQHYPFFFPRFYFEKVVCGEKTECNKMGNTDLFTDFNHMSIAEARKHLSFTVRFICSRGTSHELVRHTVQTEYTQESTRYCDYSGEISVILPSRIKRKTESFEVWKKNIEQVAHSYTDLRKYGFPAQFARGCLPIDVKTEVVTTATIWQWDHIFRQRLLNPRAHPDIQRIMRILYHKLNGKTFQDIFWNNLFDDLTVLSLLGLKKYQLRKWIDRSLHDIAFNFIDPHLHQPTFQCLRQARRELDSSTWDYFKQLKEHEYQRIEQSTKGRQLREIIGKIDIIEESFEKQISNPTPFIPL